MNNKIGDVTSTYIKSLIETGESLGVDRSFILKQNKLSEQLINDPKSRLGLVTLMKVGNTIIHLAREPALGLIAGKASVITSLGYPGLLAMSASTLGEALEMITRFEPLTSRCNRGQSGVDVVDGKPTMTFYSIAPYNEYNLFVVDRVLSSFHFLIPWLTGQEDLVTEVHFEFEAPTYADKYRQFFNCPVKFATESNSLELVESALEIPVIFHNRSLFDSLLITCEQLLAELSQTETIGQMVQKALGPMLHEGNPSLESVAQELRMQPWTLRRRLSDQDLSFHNILEDMRKDLAINYVKNPKLSFGEIAYRMGFSSASAFQRAFKRWTGTTAGEFRKKHI